MTNQPTAPDPDLIRRLEAAELEHAVTAITPLSHDGPKNQVRIKNQIHNVSRAIEQHFGKRAVADLHDRLQRIAGGIRQLQRPASWCVMTDGTTVESLVLPERFGERLIEGTRYYVRPLIESAAAHERFLLLAISQGDVRLHRVDGERMTEVQVDGLPGALTDVVGHEVEQQALQHHTAGRAIFHAQGKGHDDRGAELVRFLQAIDQAINEDQGLRDEPLMIAAVERVDALFRQISQHRALVRPSVRLSPDQTSIEDLRQGALEAAATWRRERTQALLEALAEDPRRTTADPGEIIRASIEGRVDTLIVEDDDTSLWGSFDADSRHVDLHEERQPDSEDLIDTAIRATWRQSGHVCVAGGARQDPSRPLMALLRF
jgi:hypothetical protein